MNRISWKLLIFYFVGYVILQIPLLHKFVLFDVAFSFFYLGFLLFFPLGQNPILRLTAGFLTGLFIDLFSNTPGLWINYGSWMGLFLTFDRILASTILSFLSIWLINLVISKKPSRI
jgi:hypothetical protein